MATSRGKAGGKGEPAAPAQRTCFVVTGFGNKTDYATGRVLNLDKTFELLVQPACDAVEVNAFRAIDANLAGSIDAIMYHWIYAADIVIADLSTLNANVFYELGVRHALKPNTTIIIAEAELIKRIPFDLGSFVVLKYEHSGDTIAEPEQARFIQLLSGVIRKILDAERVRQQQSPALARLSDSPVFTHLKDLTPASYTAKVSVLPPAWVPPDRRPAKGTVPGRSLSSLIDRAEAAKDTKRYAEAIDGFRDAIQAQTNGSDTIKPDIFLVQRLALVTYKHGERKGADGQPDKAVAVQALHEAWAILQRHCEPATSNDPETLGLSGAIHKRLFDWNGDLQDLDLSIWFYERGFYVKRDYYNGINAAYMYTLRSTLLSDRFEAIVSHGHANMIRRQVVTICRELMRDERAFNARTDRGWVVLSLAEAWQGLGNLAEEAQLAPLIAGMASLFGKDTHDQQRARLQAAIDDFNRRVRPDELRSAPAPAAPDAPAAPAAPAAAASAAAAAAPGQALVHHAGPGLPITIEPRLLPGRTVKSIEVSCKVEYS